MNSYDVKRFESDAALAQTAANSFVDAIAAANGKPFLVALSGGRITKQFFSFTVEAVKARQAAVNTVHFFWADERCVPPDHPDSNFILANESLFKPLNIGPEQIHRLKGELPQEQAVAEANAEFEKIAGTAGQLDLVLLGMGEDGHIASQFPNATPETLATSAPFLRINNSPKPPPDRLSLSYVALTSAKAVWVLASGAGKEVALKQSLQTGDPQTPLGRLLQLRTQTCIFTDIRI